MGEILAFGQSGGSAGSSTPNDPNRRRVTASERRHDTSVQNGPVIRALAQLFASMHDFQKADDQFNRARQAGHHAYTQAQSTGADQMAAQKAGDDAARKALPLGVPSLQALSSYRDSLHNSAGKALHAWRKTCSDGGWTTDQACLAAADFNSLQSVDILKTRVSPAPTEVGWTVAASSPSP